MVLLHRRSSILEPGAGVRVIPPCSIGAPPLRLPDNQSNRRAEPGAYIGIVPPAQLLPMLRPLLCTRFTCSFFVVQSSSKRPRVKALHLTGNEQQSTHLPMMICALLISILCAVPRVVAVLRFDGHGDKPRAVNP
jgi:hypothetical protein